MILRQNRQLNFYAVISADRNGKVVVSLQEKQIKRLAGEQRMLKIGYGGVIFLYILSILMLLKDIRITIILVNITTIFYFVVMRGFDKKYNRDFAKISMEHICQKHLEEVRVTRKGTITSHYLSEAGLFPIRTEGGGVACGMAVSGKKEGLKAEICEMTVCYNRPGSPNKRKVGIMTGVWIELEQKKKTGKRMVLIHKEAMDSELCPSFYEKQGLCGKPIRGSKFGNEFFLFAEPGTADSDADAFIRKSRKLMEKSLKEDCRLMLQDTGHSICVFLNHKTLISDTPIRGTLTEKMVMWDRIPELNMALQLVN